MLSPAEVVRDENGTVSIPFRGFRRAERNMMKLSLKLLFQSPSEVSDVLRDSRFYNGEKDLFQSPSEVSDVLRTLMPPSATLVTFQSPSEVSDVLRYSR